MDDNNFSSTGDQTPPLLPNVAGGAAPPTGAAAEPMSAERAADLFTEPASWSANPARTGRAAKPARAGGGDAAQAENTQIRGAALPPLPSPPPASPIVAEVSEVSEAVIEPRPGPNDNANLGGTSEVADAFGAHDQGLGDWDEEDSIVSWKLVASLVVVLALAAMVVWKISSGSSTSVTTKPTTTIAPAGVVPSAGADISDTFAGESVNGLGMTSSGAKWETPVGVWGKKNGHAFVVTPEPGKRSVALVDVESPNASVSAKASKVAGWGLVFRYKGPFNYWALTTAPNYGTYNLLRVVNGKAISAGSTSLVKVEDGAIVGVDYQGSDISIVVNGNKVETITDPANGSGTKVGLLADASSKEAEWSDFKAKGLGGKAPVGKPTSTTSASAGPGSGSGASGSPSSSSTTTTANSSVVTASTALGKKKARTR